MAGKRTTFIVGENWRLQSNFADMVEPGCATCRVRMDRLICKKANLQHNACPIAKGRFKMIWEAVLKKLGSRGKFERTMQVKDDKAHLTGSAERLAIEEGRSAKMEVEKMKIMKDLGEWGREPVPEDEVARQQHKAVQSGLVKELDELRKRIRDCSKDASRYGRECGVHAHIATGPAPAFDSEIFGG